MGDSAPAVLKRAVASGPKGRVLLVDSITMVTPDDAGSIVVSGSHGGASSGNFALEVPLAFVVFNDAGVGKDDAGIAALPMLQARGVPGCTVAHTSARIGDALDLWERGVISHVNAAARGLDPYLVAALVLQESNFDPVIKSHANAVGLMQVLPSTGRGYARKLGIRPFSAGRLTDAETNVRIGTQIFADTIKKFGGVHFALAAYNAGDSRVFGWQRERPGMPQDEFIDDIPFPETQNYVKRILGTAEDYRRLYGPKK